jgi:hypoxanthine phosphoribosyltransferase
MIRELVSSKEVARRTAEIGSEIAEYYSGRDLLLVMVANGGVFFGSDLARNIKLDFPVDIIAVSSYHNDQQAEELVFRCPPKLDCSGKCVLLVDEVLDSGNTLAATAAEFIRRGAKEVKTAVLVTKERARSASAVRKADWSCFNLPDVYLVGCGLDSNELYRNLDFLGVVE